MAKDRIDPAELADNLLEAGHGGFSPWWILGMVDSRDGGFSG
jgi:hypothetical protein